MQIRLLGIMLVLFLLGANVSAQVQTSPCANGKESGLPLPSSFLPAKLADFQTQLKSFLTSEKYKNLKWCEDKKLRDTGPFVNNVSYGVHPTVKIHYSPAVIDWLLRKDPNNRDERFAVWRVALVADGIGRPRSDFLCATGKRSCFHQEFL